jgi:hypothetical protein
MDGAADTSLITLGPSGLESGPTGQMLDIRHYRSNSVVRHGSSQKEAVRVIKELRQR